MKNKINRNMKNEIYVLNQPQRSIISLVLVDSQLPLEQTEHEKIDKLRNFSDVFFIFSDDIFSETKKIEKNKFTSLYEACGYIDGGSELCEMYLKTILYCLEIFEHHVGFCIIRLSDLKSVDVDRCENNIVSLTASSVSSPVFKTRRLTSDEFYDIYKKSNSGNIIFKKQQDTTNMYCSYTSESNILFIKRATLGTIIDFWKSSSPNKYIDSFSITDPRYFFASIMRYLTIKTIDSEVENLDIGKLK